MLAACAIPGFELAETKSAVAPETKVAVEADRNFARFKTAELWLLFPIGVGEDFIKKVLKAAA